MFYWLILIYPIFLFLRDVWMSIALFILLLIMTMHSFFTLKQRGELPKRTRLMINIPVEETPFKETPVKETPVEESHVEGARPLVNMKGTMWGMLLSFGCALLLFLNHTPRVLIHELENDEISGYCMYLNERGFDLYAPFEGKIRKFKVFKKQVDPSFENKMVTVAGCSDQSILPANRGGFDYDSYLKAYEYHGYLYPRVVERVEGEEQNSPAACFLQPKNIFCFDPVKLYMRIKLRLAIFRSEWIQRSSFLDENSRILIKALLFGEIEPSWLSSYSKRLGIIHLFVISGMHFSLIAGGFRKICNALFRGHFHLVEFLHLLFCVVFLWFNAFSVGALRAFLMVLLRSVCFYTKRVYDAKRILMLIGGIWILCNPNILFQASFQLSFLGTMFVVECSQYKWIKHMDFVLLKSFLISAGTCVCLFPLLYVHYQQTHLIAIVILPLLTPLVCIFLFLSVFYLPLDMICDWNRSMSILRESRVMLMNLMEEISGLIRKFMQINTLLSEYSIAFLYLIALFLSVFVITFFLLKNFRRDITLRSDILVFTLILSCTALFFHIDFGFTIRSFALRDGESYLIRWNKTNLVYDVGNDKEIINCLKRCGVQKIDVLVISHFDSDHCGMLDEVLEHFEVESAIFSPLSRQYPEKYDEGEAHSPFIAESRAIRKLKSLEKQEFETDGLRRRFELDEATISYSCLSYEELSSSGTIEAFSSTQALAANKPAFHKKKGSKVLNKNERSIIMSIEYRGKKVLLNGDIEQKGLEFQKALFDREIRHADIVKIPHHGSYREGFEQLIDDSQPYCYLIAGGRGKKIKKRETLRLLRKKGVAFYDTNHGGEILICFRFGRWRVMEYRNEL